MTDLEELHHLYRSRYENVLKQTAQKLEQQLQDHLEDIPRIDRISARAKSVDRFLQKAVKQEDDELKYTDPINQIQDQIGARIVTFYLDDINRVSEEVEGYYRSIETQIIVPDSESEFGYFGKHYIFLLPEELLEESCSEQTPDFFELQIKTLFQHAWGEAEHDLGYKSQTQVTKEEKRKIAFTAAQAWGADEIFSELFKAKKSRCDS